MDDNIVKFGQVEEKVLTIRTQQVILDSDVAELYGVATKEINQSVKNNLDKFPQGYVIEVTKEEKRELVKKIDRFNRLKHSTVLPSAFTEKGLYMLATILKSPKAVQTTIAIVETFAKIRELSRTVAKLTETTEQSTQKSLMQKSGEIVAEILDDDLIVTDTETSFEINFALMSFKHVVKQKRR
jgi:phage regulator Rha-like protein